jgi:chromosome segregation ATPase
MVTQPEEQPKTDDERLKYIQRKLAYWKRKLAKAQEEYNAIRDPKKSELGYLVDQGISHISPSQMASFNNTRKGQNAWKKYDKTREELTFCERKVESWEHRLESYEYSKTAPELDFTDLNKKVAEIRKVLRKVGGQINQSAKGKRQGREWRMFVIKDSKGKWFSFNIDQRGTWQFGEYILGTKTFNALDLEQVFEELENILITQGILTGEKS